ncbi:hypothetical protein EJ02DRAFT_14516 [Clathrospora elynae]|uniref:Uncharacterized protein n=1 Tax=Clathrospora elynae TaxID=706981 RepID=A0A6A5T033_9PLEO|nr:hypothetical protein EJ02DRAFT_14516 [Clathrospora elynae]
MQQERLQHPQSQHHMGMSQPTHNQHDQQERHAKRMQQSGHLQRPQHQQFVGESQPSLNNFGLSDTYFFGPVLNHFNGVNHMGPVAGQQVQYFQQPVARPQDQYVMSRHLQDIFPSASKGDWISVQDSSGTFAPQPHVQQQHLAQDPFPYSRNAFTAPPPQVQQYTQAQKLVQGN